MWEAQAINMLKAPIVATGSAMMMFAPTIRWTACASAVSLPELR
jgi:hypothetical protein